MLAREVLLAPLLASDGEHSTGVPKVEAVASEMKDIGLVAPREEPMVKESGVLAVASEMKDIGLVAPREELLVTLKALCFVCVCMLVVQVLILLVLLVK